MFRPEISRYSVERYTTVSALADIFAGVGFAPRARVLDVEANLADLGSILGRYVVFSLVEAERPLCFVRSFASELPFRKESFDAVLVGRSLRLCEPAFRDAYIAELVRVTRESLVIIGRFDTPAISEAMHRREELKRCLDRRGCEKLAPRASLPSLSGVWGELVDAGGRCVALPVGDLDRTFAMQAGAILAGVVPGGSRVFDESMPALLRDFGDGLSDDSPAQYALFWSRSGCIPDSVLALPHFTSPMEAIANENSGAERVVALSELAAKLLSALGESGGAPKGLGGAYVEQLTRAVEQQEAALMNKCGRAPRGSLIFRAMRKVRSTMAGHA